VTSTWKLDSDYKLLQTHISENQVEVAAVRGLFRDCKNYADVYDKARLLTKKVSHS
jgi:guanine deaminase